MRKFYIPLVLCLCTLFCIGANAQIFRTTMSSLAISTDTLYNVDFNTLPSTWTAGDYDIITLGSTGSKTVNGITFSGGPNGERIHIKTTMSVASSGNYSLATPDDAGATTGAISFIAANSGNAGGYLTLPQLPGSSDITIWACGANTSNTQSYKLEASKDGGSTWSTLGTFSTKDRSIHKSVFAYKDTLSCILKLTCTTGSKSNANLYIYNILVTQRPSIIRTSGTGTDAQIVSTQANELIEDITYKWAGNATDASISWTGTSDVNTSPTGLTVTKNVADKTMNISGTPTVVGNYSYSVTSTNGTIFSDTLSGTIKVIDTPVPLLSLTSATGTNLQKVVQGNNMTNVEYTWSGSAVDAIITWTGTTSATNPPDGITVNKDVSNEKITISGAPSTPGTYTWSVISTDNTLNSQALSGSLTVSIPPQVTLTSSAGTDAQTVPFCQSITNIVYTYGGSATSATLTWSGTPSSSTIPAGMTVTTNSTAKTVTISGTPYLAGTFGYSIVSTDGTNNSSSLNGSIISSATADTQLSFPGAVGYGSHATGGRYGSVYHVTTLDDSGKGSLRDALSSSNRIVVFDVSGIINLRSAISSKGNITIEGQTAPGEGIAVHGGEISFASQQNIICRHLRIVTGDPATNANVSSTDDALSLYNARNAIFDHCTFEFAPWNNIDGVSDSYTITPVTAITLQNCIDANPTGQQFGAHCESVLSQWTFYRNLFANSHNRNPLAKINDQFINNVHYNNGAGYTTHSGTSFKHDIVNNYFIGGPASTSSTSFPWFQVDGNQSILNSGNYLDQNSDGQLNGALTSIYWYSDMGTLLSSPWSPLTTLIPTVDATSAFRTVVSHVGTQPLSQMDSLIINQTLTLGNGTTGTTAGTTGPDGGLYTSISSTGLANNGYGIIRSGSICTDSDGDGMPDYWESAVGTNLSSNDAMQIASNGYANIENYANWLGDLHDTTNVNVAKDIDLAKYCGGFAAVSPTYSVASSTNGTATMNGSTVHFTPSADYKGLASIQFTVTGSDNSSYTDSIKVLVTPLNTSGIISSNENALIIFPSPANTILNISNIEEKSPFQIYDMSGKIVISGLTSTNGKVQQVNVGALSEGVYQINVKNKKGTWYSRFIKK